MDNKELKEIFEDLGLPPIYYYDSDYFIICGYSPVQKKRCILGLYDNMSRAVSAALAIKDHFNYSDIVIRGININSIEIFEV